MDENKWQLLLTYADNGMILDNPNYVAYREDSCLGDRLLEVVEMGDGDESLEEAKMLKSVIFKAIDYFGLQKVTSKHSKYNISIKVIDTETGEEV
jgi:hypothetical protein